MAGKKLQELTIKDNFMFSAVMMEEENCKQFLEMTLGFPIARVKVTREKSMVYHPEYKGIRLDIYAKDGKNTHYNIEMQALRRPALTRRARYYHSQMDMELLAAGKEYKELPDVYVIFVCDFDPFGHKKYCYTFENRSDEVKELKLRDGSHSIFLSTYGDNNHEVSAELVKFLRFVKAEVSECMDDFEDDYVKQLQKSVRTIKTNREMEARFMIFKERTTNGRIEGREDGRQITLIRLIRRWKEKDKAVEELMELLEQEQEEAEWIWNALEEHPDESDQEIFERIYGEWLELDE